VLIIGGGTSLTMKQVLKYDVDEAVPLRYLLARLLRSPKNNEPEAVEALHDPRAAKLSSPTDSSTSRG
jgi:spermidine synthase